MDKKTLSEIINKVRSSKLLRPKNAILIIIIIILTGVVIPQLSKFSTSLNYIHNINYYWLAMGLAFSLLTFLASSYSYYVLAMKPLNYGRTVITQGASMFANHLFPAGIGSLGVSYRYLIKHEHTKSEAVTIVYLNNLLGFIGYLIILIYIVLVAKSQLSLPLKLKFSYLYTIVSLAVLVSIMLILRSNKFRQTINNFVRQLKDSLFFYRDHKTKLVLSMLSIMGLTILYGLSLFCCVRAVGLTISLSEALIVLAISVLGKTVTPTPGGVIGAEAGLFAGLVAYGASSPQALVIVIVYRLVTYWAPFAIGGLAFSFVSKRSYI